MTQSLPKPQLPRTTKRVVAAVLASTISTSNPRAAPLQPTIPRDYHPAKLFSNNIGHPTTLMPCCLFINTRTSPGLTRLVGITTPEYRVPTNAWVRGVSLTNFYARLTPQSFRSDPCHPAASRVYSPAMCNQPFPSSVTILLCY